MLLQTCLALGGKHTHTQAVESLTRSVCAFVVWAADTVLIKFYLLLFAVGSVIANWCSGTWSNISHQTRWCQNSVINRKSIHNFVCFYNTVDNNALITLTLLLWLGSSPSETSLRGAYSWGFPFCLSAVKRGFLLYLILPSAITWSNVCLLESNTYSKDNCEWFGNNKIKQRKISCVLLIFILILQVSSLNVFLLGNRQALIYGSMSPVCCWAVLWVPLAWPVPRHFCGQEEANIRGIITGSCLFQL